VQSSPALVILSAVSCYIMRPKQTILFLLLSVLTACSNTGQNEALPSTDSVQEFPTDFIKKVCSERKDEFRLVNVDFKKLNPIDSSFYKKWFDNKKVNNVKDFILTFDKYTSYYFYDFKDLDKKLLFSIINDDEIGYYHLFHFTFDKEKKQFTQIDYIGQTGGDGGDYNEDNFKFNSNGDILILTSISTYDEDFDGGYTQQYDSTVTQIEFDLLKTKYSKLDNLNRTDTIWDKK